MEPLIILIVDDEPDMRLYLRSCLRGLKRDVGGVLEATDGLEALQLVRSGAVNLVITDVALPLLDGYALCRAIKDDPQLRHLAVLLISGEDGSPSAEVTADGFLAKPFNTRQLQTELEGLLLRLQGSPPDRTH